MPGYTCPCGSCWLAGKRRAGADDRESTGSASHRARKDGLSKHAGRPQGARSTGDASNHCDRGLPAAACGDRSFFYPVSVCCLVRQPDDAGAPTIRRRRSVPGGTRPCCPAPPCIPADCVLAGPRMLRCRTGRTPRRRLSHAPIRKDRASFARGRRHKGFIGRERNRNGRNAQEVAKLKHALRKRRQPCSGNALRDKAHGRCGKFSRRARHPSARICRPDSRVRRRETFHVLYTGAGTRARAGRARCAAAGQPTR